MTTALSLKVDQTLVCFDYNQNIQLSVGTELYSQGMKFAPVVFFWLVDLYRLPKLGLLKMKLSPQVGGICQVKQYLIPGYKQGCIGC